jgi:hypothetical protein
MMFVFKTVDKKVKSSPIPRLVGLNKRNKKNKKKKKKNKKGKDYNIKRKKKEKCIRHPFDFGCSLIS